MTKPYLVAAPLLLALTLPLTTHVLAKETTTSAPESYREVGHEVAAPPWSAACMTDRGPSVCDEPVWVYGSPAAVAHYRSAF
jgi:hypothetical protein